MILTELPFGLPGHIFRSPMPCGGYDPHGVLLRSYLHNQIAVVVLLAEEEECLRQTRRNRRLLYLQVGMHVLALPIPDLSVPAQDALDRVVTSTIAYAQAGQHIVIHCAAGIGRRDCLRRLLPSGFLVCLGRRHFSGFDVLFLKP